MVRKGGTVTTILVWMLRHEEGSTPPNRERVEVLRFEWDPGHALPRAGETIVGNGLPLIVRHVEWDPGGTPAVGLTPTIEVSRRPDHPALQPDEEDGEAGS